MSLRNSSYLKLPFQLFKTTLKYLVWYPALLLGFWSLADMAAHIPAISGNTGYLLQKQEAERWQNAPAGFYMMQRCPPATFSPEEKPKPPVLAQDCQTVPVPLNEKVILDANRAFSGWVSAVALSVLCGMLSSLFRKGKNAA